MENKQLRNLVMVLNINRYEGIYSVSEKYVTNDALKKIQEFCVKNQWDFSRETHSVESEFKCNLFYIYLP